MATLLMIESWVHSTGLCLPPRLRDRGHDYVLLTRDEGIYPPAACGTPHPVVAEADEIVVVDTNDLDALCTGAEAVAARRPVHGVVTTCDYYLEAAAVVAERLGLPGGPPEALHVATRKHLVRRALDGAGLPNPRYAVVAGWDEARLAAEALGYPLVAKPVDLNSGTAVRRVDDDTGLKDAVAEVTAPATNTRGQALHRLVLLEGLLTGTEVSVEAVTRAGRTTVVAITDKSVTGPPAFVESGHMVPAPLAPGDEAAVESLVVATLDAIGLTHGLSHTEVMVTPQGPLVVEVNPRQGGGYIFDLVDLVTGTHPLDTLVDLALGEAPAVGTVRAPLPRPAGGAGRPGRSAQDGHDGKDGHDGPTGRAEAAGRVASAAVAFAMSPVPGTVERVVGAELLDRDPGILRWVIPTPAEARKARDNDAYLGHLVAVDPDGPGARRRAEAALGAIRLRLADGREVTPLGMPTGLP